MTKRREAVLIGLATLLALYLFFSPLLPPIRRYHLIGDVEGYHYPLLNYAFQSLHEGRFPLWDPTIYCGLSFVGNIQAQLFYPFTWILFAAQWHRRGLQFMALQVYAIAHLWILIQLAYWWMRSGRSLPVAASLLGAMTLALTGYVLNDLQHLGVVCALTWFPLALWGVDRRRVWLIAVAGAMAFLAGYPATWIAFSVTVFFYACFTAWRFVAVAVLGLLLSLGLAGIQLLPTLELARFRPPEPVYGVGPPLEWHLFRFFPSALQQDQYLYYGFAFLIALPSAVVFRQRILLLPLGLAAVGWIFLQDPRQWISAPLATLHPSLVDVIQHWNFNAILSVAAALFVAIAWAPLASRFPKLTLAVIPVLMLEQYRFGATREYFRQPGHNDRTFLGDRRTGGDNLRGMSAAAYRELLAHPEFRTVVDDCLHGTDLRHYGLTTPNGFDPFLTAQFRRQVEQFVKFDTNRLFRIDVFNEEMLQAFGVGYVLAREKSAPFRNLSEAKHFEPFAPSKDHFQVFVYKNRKPAVRFSSTAEVEIRKWKPENREVQVHSDQAGWLTILEQHLPGWRVGIDGKEALLEAGRGPFLTVRIPDAGAHTVTFDYAPPSLRWGSILSFSSGIVLVVLLWRRL